MKKKTEQGNWEIDNRNNLKWVNWQTLIECFAVASTQNVCVCDTSICKCVWVSERAAGSSVSVDLSSGNEIIIYW